MYLFLHVCDGLQSSQISGLWKILAEMEEIRLELSDCGFSASELSSRFARLLSKNEKLNGSTLTFFFPQLLDPSAGKKRKRSKSKNPEV